MSIISPVLSSVRSSVRSSIAGGSDPVITLQPTNAVVAISSAAVFTVDYTGTEPITGQWEEYK